MSDLSSTCVMTRNATFWIRLLIAGAALLLCGAVAQAQSPAAISFDALPRAQRADTARPRVAPRRGSVAALRDSIARLNRLLATPRAVVGTPVRDSLWIIQTPLEGSPVEPVPAPATAKPAGTQPAFAAPVVSGLLHLLLSGGDSALRSTYRIRRAEVKLVSDLGRRVQATIMIDVSKALALGTSATQTTVTQSSRALQDAFLSVPAGTIQIDAGQLRLPLGYEGSHSSSTLETVDRALMESDRARGASFGDVRDVGVAGKGKWRWIEYRAGLFNGSGESMNETDRNAGKAVVGQLALRPAGIRGLRVGTSGATSGAAAGDKPARDRLGVDLVWVRGSAHVQAEAMRGQDGAIRRGGLYALSGISVRPNIKLVARFDAWDPNTQSESNVADVTERDYLAGVTWLPTATRLKVQGAVVRKTYSSSITPSATLALIQFQASW
jgi:hypothetical protein